MRISFEFFSCVVVVAAFTSTGCAVGTADRDGTEPVATGSQAMMVPHGAARAASRPGGFGGRRPDDDHRRADGSWDFGTAWCPDDMNAVCGTDGITYPNCYSTTLRPGVQVAAWQACERLPNAGSPDAVTVVE